MGRRVLLGGRRRSNAQRRDELRRLRPELELPRLSGDLRLEHVQRVNEPGPAHHREHLPGSNRDAGAVVDRARWALAAVRVGQGELATALLRRLALGAVRPLGERERPGDPGVQLDQEPECVAPVRRAGRRSGHPDRQLRPGRSPADDQRDRRRWRPGLRYQDHLRRQLEPVDHDRGAPGRADDRGRPVPDCYRVSRTFRRRRDELFARRRGRPVARRGQRGDCRPGTRRSQPDLLKCGQRPGRQRHCWLVCADDPWSDDPPADGDQRLLRSDRRRSALCARSGAHPHSRPTRLGPRPPPPGPREDPRPKQDRHTGSLPSTLRSAANSRPRSLAVRQDPRAPPRHSLQQTTRPVRKENDGSWLARHHSGERAQRPNRPGVRRSEQRPGRLRPGSLGNDSRERHLERQTARRPLADHQCRLRRRRQCRASSGQGAVVVPASIRLHVPRHAHWGGKLVLTGRLRGGYLPAVGETVILSVRFGGHEHDFAHLAVSGNGRFRYVYTFLPGNGVASYPFMAETVRESGYAYAPGRSAFEVAHVTP